MKNTTREQRISAALTCNECRKWGKWRHTVDPELSARQWTIAHHHDWRTHASEAVQLAQHIDALNSWAVDGGPVPYNDDDEAAVNADLDEMGRWFSGDDDAADGLYGLVTELNDTIAGLERLEEVAEARLAVLDGEGAAVVNGGPVVTPQPQLRGHLSIVKDE